MNSPMNDRQISIFMYFNLMKQAFEWQAGLIGMNNREMKHRFNIAQNANRNLLDEMEKELERDDPANVEQFWKDSEVFSKILETIRKAETPEKKQELIMILREYNNGNIKFEYSHE